MQREFVQGSFSEQPLQCSNCNWQGTGAEAIVIDFYGVTKNREVHCPQCDEPLGLLRQDNNSRGEDAAGTGFRIG
jgi:hypothetical protein